MKEIFQAGIITRQVRRSLKSCHFIPQWWNLRRKHYHTNPRTSTPTHISHIVNPSPLPASSGGFAPSLLEAQNSGKPKIPPSFLKQRKERAPGICHVGPEMSYYCSSHFQSFKTLIPVSILNKILPLQNGKLFAIIIGENNNNANKWSQVKKVLFFLHSKSYLCSWSFLFYMQLQDWP